jgi:hypothetical protein
MRNKNIIVFLFILAASVYVIFFTAEDYQKNPDLFAEKKKVSINNPANTEEKKFLDEYELGEYLFKNGELEKAYQHFRRVYYHYYDVPKSILKLNSLHYMKEIAKRLEEKANMDQSDTNLRIKKYFENLD